MLIDDKNHYERVFSIDEEGNITSWGLKAKNEEVIIEKKRRELTEQQKKVITNNKDLNELSHKLGGFVSMYYVKNELLFNEIDIMEICPCSGNTIGKLAIGIMDTPVLKMARKILRSDKSLVLGIATADGLARKCREHREIIK